jgi:hypothetical protein
MSLDKFLRIGTPPWQPADEAEAVSVWHAYDTPLVGTFRILHQLVLFTVIEDTSNELTVWAYIPISGENEHLVSEGSFASVAKMREFIVSMFAGHEATFALAWNKRLWKWITHTVLVEEGVRGAATAAIRHMISMTVDEREVPSPDVLLQTVLAQAEHAVDDLVDA